MTTARNHEFIPIASHFGVIKMPIITGSNSEIMAIKVDVEEFLSLVEAMEEVTGVTKEQEVYGRAAMIIERYQNTIEASAVIKRLGGMSDMMNDPRMRGWGFEDSETDTIATNQAVLRATALCPLRERGKNLTFDADEFFRIVLEQSEGDAEA